MRLFTVLRIFRAFKGYDLKELAEEIGISSRELSAIERGKSLASGAAVGSIVRWLLSEDKPLPERTGDGRSTKTDQPAAADKSTADKPTGRTKQLTESLPGS